MRKNSLVMLGLAGMLLFIGCSKTESAFKYELRDVHPVAGRQGVCKENGYYWISGSATLAKYDSDWNLIAENTDPIQASLSAAELPWIRLPGPCI